MLNTYALTLIKQRFCLKIGCNLSKWHKYLNLSILDSPLTSRFNIWNGKLHIHFYIKFFVKILRNDINVKYQSLSFYKVLLYSYR